MLPLPARHPMPLLVICELSRTGSRGCMMLGMHPWTGLSDDVRRGVRVAAVDGFLLDVPDTPVNRAEFGGPVSRGQPAVFPQARVVTLTETGTHSSVDARVGGYCAGEQELAVAMARSAAGMLVIM